MIWEREMKQCLVSSHRLDRAHKRPFVQTANLLSDSRPCEMMSTKCKNNALAYHMSLCVCELNNATCVCITALTTPKKCARVDVKKASERANKHLK